MNTSTTTRRTISSSLSQRCVIVMMALAALFCVTQSVNPTAAQAADPTGYVINNASAGIKVVNDGQSFYVAPGRSSSYYTRDADSFRTYAGSCGYFHYSGQSTQHLFGSSFLVAVGANVIVVDRTWRC